VIETPRLVLRRWREEDRGPLAALHADPEVMDWLGGVKSRAESDGYLDRYEAHIEAHGFGIWAVTRREDGVLLGVAGLRWAEPGLPPAPCVEAAWRFARLAWGQGYASEAAGAALRDGFRRHGLREALAWTAPSNLRSQAVMARIGMARDPSRDFEHPALPEGHPLRPHLVFAARAPGNG
jgi:RimJ/RimL family protein N-acetyltransferase